jgi:hypothetical protein
MWPFKRQRRDLDQLRDRAERTASEAREVARKVEPTLAAMERRKPKNGIYEEVLATLRPRPRGGTT